MAISRCYSMPLTAFPVGFLVGQQVTMRLGAPLMKVTSRLVAAISVGVLTAVFAIFFHWCTNSLPTIMGEAGSSDL